MSEHCMINIVGELDERLPVPETFNVPLKREIAPNGLFSHLRVGDLRKSISYLSDDAYVGVGIVGQRTPEFPVETFSFINVDKADEDSHFLWIIVGFAKA